MADFFGNKLCDKCSTVHAPTDKCLLAEGIISLGLPSNPTWVAVGLGGGAATTFSSGAATTFSSKISGAVPLESVEQAKHDDRGKPPLGQLSRHALVEVANVLLWGASKYDKDNWRNGMEWSRLVNSVLRHLYAWNEGEDNDPESNLNHLSHAMCDLMFLLEYQVTHPELDDRVKHIQ